MKVVVVEDERLMALFMKEILEKQGCEVVGVFDQGATVLAFVSANPVDFVVMDVELEGEVNGIQAAIELREKFNIPSVFMTSHNDSATIKDAMQAEPLGYVIKPISASHVESMVGVVRGLLGNTTSAADQIAAPELATLSDLFSYCYQSNSLYRDGTPVDLTSSELKLFDLCLRRRGNTVPYSVIDEVVWEGKIVTDSTRRGLFHRLRNKLDKQFFETVTGIGCRVLLPG